MKKLIEKMTDDELNKWLIVNARSVGRTTIVLLIAEEITKRTIFN